MTGNDFWVRSLRYTLVDVFTDRPLAGRPLAVFTQAAGLADGVLLALARELGHPTTVFVFPPTAGGHARVRAFSPRGELPLSLSGVLGAAFVIGTTVQLDVLTLETGLGPLQVALSREGARVVSASLFAPLPTASPSPHAAALLSAFGIEAALLPLETIEVAGVSHTWILAPRPEMLPSLSPDVSALGMRLADTYGAVVQDGGVFRARVFSSSPGTFEAIAGAEAAASLVSYLVRHGVVASGTTIELTSGAMIHRPTTIFATAWRDGDALTRVEVGGAAVIIGRAELKLLL